MSITLIFTGLFLLFAFSFNGSVGTTVVNFTFVTSALLIITAGVLNFSKSKQVLARNTCIVALVAYTPMIWQRFNFTFGIDGGGLFFDVVFVVLMLFFIYNKPNKAIKKDV